MLLAAEDLGGCAVASEEKGGQPAGTGQAEFAQGGAGETWKQVGAVAGALVERLRDLAERTAPREARAPGGTSVAPGTSRRPNSE